MKALSTLVPVSTRRAASCLLILAVASCASLPEPTARTTEPAFGAPDTTALGKMVAAAAPGPEMSGVRLLQSGEDAFGALAGLIERSQRSLDLQYYLVRDEISSRKLLREVVAAAARGVRVRVLVDDFNTAGEEDVLLCLARLPNVKVRLYNPFPAGRFSTVSRLIASAADMQRISARMHNKQLIADSALAVTGGRNLGDAYFVQSKQANFLDLDLLVAGPVVRRLSTAFDAFWNNDLAYPIEALIERKPECNGGEPAHEPPAHDTPVQEGPAPADVPAPGSTASAEKVTAGAASTARAATLDKRAAGPAADAPPTRGLLQSLRQGKLELTWVPVALLADKPAKTKSEGEPTPSETVSDDVERLLKGAQREVLVISPYFVPGARGMELFDALRRRGVTVRVLTNSLAATDAPAVHLGYARYRQPLLEGGAQLYELRPQLGAPRSSVGNFGSSRSSLHAKALVIDRSVVLVGSMNMDPRSANLNSEMGLIVRSPRLAAQLADLFADMVTHSSYAVTLYDGCHLRWTTQEGERKTEYTDEPEASALRRMLLWLIAPFAPESML